MNFLCRQFMAVALLIPFGVSAAPRQVIVYSFVTDAGRNLNLPTAQRPAHYALGNGGYHEWGGVRAGEKPMKLAQMEPLVRAALRVSAYEGLRRGEHPDLVIEFHWGCMRPDRSGLNNRSYEVIVNLSDLLDLVGSRVLESSNNHVLREMLIEAALDERYFLILSAFDPTAYARDRKELLWRTQISMPIGTMVQEHAFPILAACGAKQFGRATAEPRFVSVDVERALQAIQNSDIR
jgi:hypothetical protein